MYECFVYRSPLASYALVAVSQKLAVSHVYSKGSYQIENYYYYSHVKTQVFLFLTKSDFPIFNTRPYVEEYIT